MKLSITITCTNGAFFDDDEPNIGPECAGILRRLADYIEDETDPEAGWSQPLWDANGNTVGTAKFSIR